MNKKPELPAPADGIMAIHYAQRSLAFGIASLLPVLGLPLALMAFSNYRRARAACKGRWNPAARLLLCASTLSWLGFLISSAVLLLGLAAIFKILPWQYEN